MADNGWLLEHFADNFIMDEHSNTADPLSDLYMVERALPPRANTAPPAARVSICITPRRDMAADTEI